jgi:hypothetical protein
MLERAINKHQLPELAQYFDIGQSQIGETTTVNFAPSGGTSGGEAASVEFCCLSSHARFYCLFTYQEPKVLHRTDDDNGKHSPVLIDDIALF